MTKKHKNYITYLPHLLRNNSLYVLYCCYGCSDAIVAGASFATMGVNLCQCGHFVPGGVVVAGGSDVIVAASRSH